MTGPALRYGFVGLGNLGGALAMNLVRAGFDLVVTDRERGRAAVHEAAGARWCGSAAALAGGCDAVITSLPSPAASAQVLAELLPAMGQGTTWIEMSTVGRDDIMRLAGMEHLHDDALDLDFFRWPGDETLPARNVAHP